MREGINLNLDNVFKYTVCFFYVTPYRYSMFTTVSEKKISIDNAKLWKFNKNLLGRQAPDIRL